MEKILQKYCSSEVSETGIFLLDLPTGFGKTYHILKYIYDHIELLEKKKVFFITTLKKNLPYEELKDKFFAPNNKLELFNKSVLFIDSNQDLIINNLMNIEHKIPQHFKNNNAFHNLRTDVKFINDYERTNGGKRKGVEIKLIDQAKTNIREKHEPRFRKHITEILAKEFPKKRERKKAIRRDENYRWIGELYPPVFTDDRKVFFLSIDKFFAKNTTIIEPSYFFHEHEITKDAIIFIDEFDTTKERILNKIIENGLDKKTDFIHLFNEIHTCLMTNQFPGQLLDPSKERLEWLAKNEKANKNPIKMPEEILTDFRIKADEISERFKLPFSYKTIDAENNTRNLLFHDFTYHSVLQDDKKFVSLKHNHSEKINAIHFVDTRPSREQESVLSLLNQIRGFLNYFQKGIEIIATNYIKRRKEEDPQRNEDYTFESALHTVLDEFRLERRHRDFIIDNIVTESEFKSDLTHTLSVNLTVYDQGFRYYDFVDSDEHATQSKVYIYSFQNTPEKFLLKLAKRSKVIGVSATANIESVTGNYDIEYLKNQLGNSFLSPSSKELLSLKDSFERNSQGYDNIEIHTTYFSGQKKFTDKSLEDVLADHELTSDWLNRAKNYNNAPYNLNRYLKIAKAFKEFLLKDDIQAFLCLLNKLPKRGDYNLDINLLERLFQYLMISTENSHFKNTDEEYDVAGSFVVLSGSDFDQDKEELTKRLSEGEKLFIISTYQTIGAGQNLQFQATDSENLNLINEFPNEELWTDINALYLDKPTHLLVNVTKELNEEDFVKYLFQLEFLRDHGDISTTKLKREVNFAFKNLLTSPYSETPPRRNSNGQFEESLYKKRNYAHHLAKMIIQAVGRICRTNLKSSNIYLYADEEIYPYISGFTHQNMLLLKEFKALLEHPPVSSVEMDFTKAELDTYTNRANTFSEKTTNYIKGILSKEYWKPDLIANWRRLRSQSLKHPYLSSHEIDEHHNVIALYVELPNPDKCYSFEQKRDFDSIKIDFKGNSTQWVSENEARLKELMEIPGVLELFNKNGWKTTFEEAKYLLNPPMFWNIYLGALGEEIGKFILEKNLQIQLHELAEEHFEAFDFRIDEKTFVDFKHWRETSSFDAENEHQKIREKLGKVGGDKVYIINILAESTYQSIKSSDSRIIEIPYLYHSEKREWNWNALNSMRSELTVL